MLSKDYLVYVILGSLETVNTTSIPFPKLLSDSGADKVHGELGLTFHPVGLAHTNQSI